MKLEEMGSFFESRLADYEEHMLNGIDSARDFYAFTAGCLPQTPDAEILDLGCGTGLELDWYFPINPTAKLTGIDLADGMLASLRGKYPNKDITLICGNYFDVPFGENRFDGAVSVESLHHFTLEEKLPLYIKLYNALKPGCAFILTDYFSLSDEEERQYREELLRLKAEQGLEEDRFYHYDTPLTVAHELEALRMAGFRKVAVLNQWGPTVTVRAEK